MPETETQVTPADPVTKGKRLTRGQELLIRQLAKDGYTQTRIAELVGCSQPTVSQVLASFEDTRQLAKDKLNNSALALAERVIRKANVEESLEVLDRLDVIAKKDRSANTHGGLSVVVLMPGQASVQPPVIDTTCISAPSLSPPTFAPDAPEHGAGSR